MIKTNCEPSLVQWLRRECRLILPAALILGLAALAAAQNAPRPATLFLEAQENINLDNEPTAPAVAFTLRRGAPADELIQAPQAAAHIIGKMRTWQIQIFDRDERKVSFLQGSGEPPQGLIKWYGIDNDGKSLPNGFYSARLVWADEAGKLRKTKFISISLLSIEEMRDFLGPFVSLSFADEGLIIRIKDRLVFASGATNLQSDAFPTLDKITRFLKAHPRNRLVVNGFTDSSGSAEFNARLSQQRAEAMRTYLVSQGIDPGRVSYQGMGESRPIASNQTEEGRAKNRRVEINVLKPAQ